MSLYRAVDGLAGCRWFWVARDARHEERLV